MEIYAEIFVDAYADDEATVDNDEVTVCELYSTALDLKN